MKDSFRVESPTRVDLAGGTLDIWPVYALLGNARTINIALDTTAVAEFRVADSSEFKVDIKGFDGATARFQEPVEANALSELPASVRFPARLISEYVRARAELPALHIQLTVLSNVPPKSGLGGSSALAVAIARGLGRIFQDFTDQGWQWRILNWVKDVEAQHIGTLTGTQDYLAALFGGIQAYVSRPGGIDVQTFPQGVLEEFQSRLLVLYSGEMHDSGLSNWDILRRGFDGDQQIWGAFRAIGALSEQLDSEMRGRLSWKHIGQIISDEWRIRKEVFNVQTRRLDEIFDFLNTQKVFGARVCGAAQGGSLVVLTDPGMKGRLAESCRSHGIQVLNANCSRQGTQILPLKS